MRDLQGYALKVWCPGCAAEQSVFLGAGVEAHTAVCEACEGPLFSFEAIWDDAEVPALRSLRVTPARQGRDRMKTLCPLCGEGTLQEGCLQDGLEGKLTCTGCAVRQARYGL